MPLVSEYWSKRFYRVDEWGRSHFRLLLIGLCLIVAGGISVFVELPSSFCKSIRVLAVLGIIFVLWSGIGPTLDVMFLKFSEKKKRRR